MLNVEQTLSPFGSFATTIPLGPATPLGLYWASVQVRRSREGKDVWEDVGEATFSVEAFRAAEFRVEAQIEKRSYTVGDSVTGYLTAHYLFGAPMKGETVNWRLSVSDAQWRPKGFDGYFFGPLGWLSRYSRGNGYRVLATSKGVLDERGMIASTSRLRVGEIPGSAMLLLEGDVTSPSRQVISGRASVIVHGGEYYLGISPSSTFISVDSSLTYNLVTVNPDGKLLPKNSISVKVLKRIWRSTRKASTGGLYTWISQQEDIVVDSAVTASDVIPVAGRFTPKEAGFYFLEARSTDTRGNVLLTHAYFYVSGHGYVAWQRADDDKIELVPSKENYLPGERAHIIVKSPFETARALVTVEREGILWNFTAELKGSAAQIDIPIVSRYLPNIFVSVVLLEGRTLPPGATREGDIGRPTFKIGYTSLSVSPLEKQLSVALACDKEEYRPGDSVRVNIVVKNALGTGVSAEVALSVADLGILSLIGYRMPSLYDIFYQHHDLRVTTAETRTHIIEQRIFGEKGGEPGGGGGDDEVLTALMNVEGIRKDFRPSAYWNPSIQTDADGRATVRFKLSDNLTKFQMMASASTREAEFGYGEQSFTVSKPLMVMPALPRFARVGDAFEGGVTVFNYSSKEKLVRLISKTTGIKSQGADTTMRMLKPGQAVEMRRQLFAEFVGEAKFVFAAVTDDDTDGVQWSIPIEMRQLSETVALSGTVTGSIQREEIITPKGIYSDVGGFDFTVASTALVQLSGGMSYLFTYPYGCLEQRVSAALPVILAEDMVNAFKFEVFKDKDHKQVVQKTLDELPLFQRPNGGFAYWEKAEETYPYVSAYALYAAVVARRAGYDVDESMMSAGFQYLQRVLRGEERARYETPQITSCTKALVLYTFALAGKPDHGYMERLYEEGMKSTEATTQLPLFAKAYLLKALHVSKGNQAMIRDLSQDLLNRVKISPVSAHFEESGANGMEWIFHSNVRTTALVMQALIETQPESPLIPKTVRWLLDEQRSGRWRTTQENLYVVDALSTYFRVYEQQEPNFRARLTLAGKGLLNQIFQGRSLKTASARLPLRGFSEGTRCNLDVIKSGQGRLYYTARMTYYPKGESTVKEEGIFVSKSIETLDHVPLAQHFKAGTIAKVTLTIASNQDRNYVVVDDPLPAGFETVNLSFQTTAKNLNSSGEPQHEDRMQFDYSFDHTEMHDDRVLLFEDYLPAGVHTFSYLVRVTSFGEFQMPSTRAEAMYEPEVFGQTSSCHVRID
jgi:hypothetical protein